MAEEVPGVASEEAVVPGPTEDLVAEGLRKTKAADDEFSTLVYRLHGEKEKLAQGIAPLYETPEQIVSARAQELGKDEHEYAEGLLAQGFDVYDAVRVMGKGESRGPLEDLFGPDPGDYISSVQKNRPEIMAAMDRKAALKRANKGRELIADALRDKAAKGEDLPIEARSYLRGDSNLKLDPVSDFISTDDVEIGGSHTASSMGLMRPGFRMTPRVSPGRSRPENRAKPKSLR